jgi:hypothetical protein
MDPLPLATAAHSAEGRHGDVVSFSGTSHRENLRGYDRPMQPWNLSEGIRVPPVISSMPSSENPAPTTKWPSEHGMKCSSFSDMHQKRTFRPSRTQITIEIHSKSPCNLLKNKLISWTWEDSRGTALLPLPTTMGTTHNCSLGMPIHRRFWDTLPTKSPPGPVSRDALPTATSLTCCANDGNSLSPLPPRPIL